MVDVERTRMANAEGKVAEVIKGNEAKWIKMGYFQIGRHVVVESKVDEPKTEPDHEPEKTAEIVEVDPLLSPVAEEPVAEPVAEEPVAEEPVAEAPAVEEPVAEEPTAEEPVAEEAAADSKKKSAKKSRGKKSKE